MNWPSIMFNLVQFLEKRGLSSGVQPIKEKITADKIQGIKPVEQLGKVPEVKSIDEPVKSLTSSITDKPLKKVAYARNTGVRDSDNNVYINREDVSLLAKLGYSVNRDEYLFLPLGESKEDLYSYIAKMAGVSKSVSKCIDQGTAFSSEHLKDMGYEVPEGYEVKGDLVCPIEKKADLASTQPAMSGNSNILQTTHSPINIQTSTQGQTTPIDHKAKNKALLAAGKDFAVNQTADTIPQIIGAGISPVTAGMGKRISNKSVAGHLKWEGAGLLGSGELAARNVDNPADANKARIKSYATNLITGQLAARHPVAAGIVLGGQTLGNIGQAADVYHKNMPTAPPSMGKVPEQKFNIPLSEPVSNNIDFRLTQPGLRDQPSSSGANIAKQGEATHELKSSNIKAVGYDKENKKLEVAFHSGGNYTYNDVPKSLFERIRKVKSPGKFFHKHIKKGNPYNYKRIEKEASQQPLLPAIRQWLKKQPFNHAEDAFKNGRIPRHVRDDVVSGRAAEKYRPRFKEMLDQLRNSGQT